MAQTRPQDLIKSIDEGKKAVAHFYGRFPELLRALEQAHADIENATKIALAQIEARRNEALGAITLAQNADNVDFMVERLSGQFKDLFS